MLPRLSSLSFSYRERSCEIAHLTFCVHFSEFEVAMYLNKAVALVSTIGGMSGTGSLL